MATSAKPEIGYADYLSLDKILNAQDLQSVKVGREAHDEMLFIIIHQTYELWFKQILHELDRVQANFSHDPVDDWRMGQILHSLLRVNEIMKLLVNQIDVLETMTSQEFLEFRDLLTSGSGFQSLQFRLKGVLIRMHGRLPLAPYTAGLVTEQCLPFFPERCLAFEHGHALQQQPVVFQPLLVRGELCKVFIAQG